MYPMRVTAEHLQLADVLKLGDYPFSYAVVKRITEDEVICFRPYATTADFSYTGGVIPYIGIEEVSLYKHDGREVEVIERKGYLRERMGT